jgi:hypothetical protein
MDELRKAFEEAYDKSEAEAEEVAQEPEAVEAEEPEVTEEPESEEESAEPAEVAEPETPEESQEPAESAESAAPHTKTQYAKAPASWSPKARQDWDKIPDGAKALIHKRDQEVNKALQDTAQARRAVQTLNQTLEPYKNGLIAAGVQDPFQAIGALFKTEATLRGGTQAEKSRMIASLINEYGVDIQTLDTVLSGQQVDDSPSSQIEQLLNQKLEPFNQFMAQQTQQAQQQHFQQTQSAQSEIQKFSETAEFLEDVRNDMADLLDMAASRNQQMTLQEAYDKACALNPDIAAIVQKRQQEKRIMESNRETRQKKAAAVSLTGKQAGNPAAAEPDNLRDAIASAWENQLG